MTALHLLVATVLRYLPQALLARRSPAGTPSPVCEEAERPLSRGPATTKWDVLKYAIDSTGRTVRLGALILVIALAALIALRAGVDLFR